MFLAGHFPLGVILCDLLKIFAARIHLVQMLESGGMVIYGGMDGADINARSGAFIAGHAKSASRNEKGLFLNIVAYQRKKQLQLWSTCEKGAGFGAQDDW
jgi:hypothetical protein